MKQDRYASLERFILENQESFYRIAFSYLRNKDDALDAVQNTVCKALENYQMLRKDTALKMWVYRILVNESMKMIREKKKVILFDNTEDKMLEQSYEDKSILFSDNFMQQIKSLDDDTQKIFILRYFEEMSLKEIATIMDMNLNTVKAKIYRGLSKLKIELKEELV